MQTGLNRVFLELLCIGLLNNRYGFRCYKDWVNERIQCVLNSAVP
jgi:hypothetical protein